MASPKEKKRLRCEVKERRAALSEEYILSSDAGILKNILSLSELERAERVLTYCSVGREADTRALISALLDSGRTVALPVTYGGGEMDFAAVDSLASLVPDRYGLPAPPEDAERLVPDEGDILVVPAVTFDEEGWRLGMGGGYYDRYIARHACVTVGLCREKLLRASVPREGHDRRVGILITEARILRFQ